jgi:hypothetical protein
LSTAAKAALVKIESPDDQKRELFKWHGAALRARDAVSGGVSRDELMRFFREELSDEVRKHLAFLPPEDFQRQLRWEYFKKKEMPPGRWREPWDHRGHGSGRDGGRRRVIILKQPGADSHSNGDRHGGPPPNHERRSSRDRDRDRPPQRSEENPGN